MLGIRRKEILTQLQKEWLLWKLFNFGITTGQKCTKNLKKIVKVYVVEFVKVRGILFTIRTRYLII